MPRTNDLHIDAALTNIAQAYGLNKEFVAPRVAPYVQVTKDTGKYFVMGYEELQIIDDVITDKTEAKEADWFATTASYATVGRALKTFVSDKAVAVADSAVDPLATTVRKLTAMLNLNREARTSAAFASATSSYTTALSNAWSTASTGTPLTNIRTAVETIFARGGVYPNAILIPRTMVPSIIATAEYRDYVKYVEPANSQLNAEIAPRLCGLDVILTSAQKSSDDLKTSLYTGTIPTLAGAWVRTSCYIAYVNPQPSVTDASFMYHLGLTPFRVRRWRDEKRGIGGGTWIQVEYEGVDKVVNSLLVHSLTGCIS